MSTASVQDIVLKASASNPETPSKKYNVAASASIIYSGDPVVVSLGAAQVATAMATNKPVVGTDMVVGIATEASTNTAALAGTVMVRPLMKDDVYLINPNVAATWDTQTEYDALVGSRVLLDLTASKYTILAADNSTYGCVIQPMSVKENPGKVAFSFRAGASYMA